MSYSLSLQFYNYRRDDEYSWRDLDLDLERREFFLRDEDLDRDRLRESDPRCLSLSRLRELQIYKNKLIYLSNANYIIHLQNNNVLIKAHLQRFNILNWPSTTVSARTATAPTLSFSAVTSSSPVSSSPSSITDLPFVPVSITQRTSLLHFGLQQTQRHVTVNESHQYASCTINRQVFSNITHLPASHPTSGAT